MNIYVTITAKVLNHNTIVAFFFFWNWWIKLTMASKNLKKKKAFIGIREDAAVQVEISP